MMSPGVAEPFLCWCLEREMKLHPSLRIGSSPHGGLGIFATHPLPAGQCAITVPKAAALCSDTWQPPPDSPALSPKHTLAWQLTEVVRSGHAAPWLDTWPQGLQGHWGLRKDARFESKLSWCVEFSNLATQQAMEAEEAYEKVSQIVPDLSYDRFTWALSHVGARAADIQPGRPAIIPLVDVLNMVQLGSECACLSFDGERFVVRTTRDLKPDDELFICYGPKDNGELLVQYGFALSPNLYERAWLRVPLPDDALAPQRRMLMPRALIESPFEGGHTHANFAWASVGWKHAERETDQIVLGGVGRGGRGGGGGGAAPNFSRELLMLLRLASAEDTASLFGAMGAASLSSDGEAADATPAAAWELLVNCCESAAKQLPEEEGSASRDDVRAPADPADRALEARRHLLLCAAEAARARASRP